MVSVSFVCTFTVRVLYALKHVMKLIQSNELTRYYVVMFIWKLRQNILLLEIKTKYTSPIPQEVLSHERLKRKTYMILVPFGLAKMFLHSVLIMFKHIRWEFKLEYIWLLHRMYVT